MKEYYSIGEMAKLNFISPHTLRYYDKINLLKPSYVDEKTGYRYYSYKDFLFLDAIQYLRHFDMSLQEIKSHFETRTAKDTLELYEKQLHKLRENIEALQNIEKRIIHNAENLTRGIKNEFSETIEFAELETRYAFVIDDIVENDDEYEVKIRKLSNTLYNHHFQYMGDYMGIKTKEDISIGNYHTIKYIGNMCMGKASYMPVKRIPGGRYLRMCYIGETQGIGKAYTKMVNFIKQKGLDISGDIIETYAVDYIDTKKVDEYVTIIEIPVTETGRKDIG